MNFTSEIFIMDEQIRHIICCLGVKKSRFHFKKGPLTLKIGVTITLKCISNSFTFVCVLTLIRELFIMS